MLATLVPIFDNNMVVSAYIIYVQKTDVFLNPLLMGTASLDGSGNVEEFDIVNSVGITGLSGNKEIFVPVSQLDIYADLKSQCRVPSNMIVLLLGHDVAPTEENLKRLLQLKQQGFKLAVRGVDQSEFAKYQVFFKLTDDIFFDARNQNMAAIRMFISKLFPNARVLISNIDSEDDYNRLKTDGPSDLYQGEFFRLPIEHGDRNLSPLKANYVRLLNVVNRPDFDLTDAAKIIGQDAALVVSLLEMVNRMTVNSGITSVQHAAAMLGQIELKKWINTAVAKALCSDKPSEIMRLSMIRARFCEQLATQFYLGMETEELFLTGMFSLIDIMLDCPMEDALQKVQVSKNISKALLDNDGKLAPVLDFVTAYEAANWPKVSSEIITKSLNEEEIYKNYLGALKWYRDIIPA